MLTAIYSLFIFAAMYPLIRSLFFRLSPEKAHHVAMSMLKNTTEVSFINKMLSGYFQVNNPSLAKNVFGLHFTNPVGMGAGFDKNAQYVKELYTLGFGSVEIGTVTPLAQPGNDLPRLFRLPKDKALINRMGFNNEGCAAVAERLTKLRAEGQPLPIIGSNIGKNKVTPNEEAWKDYIKCLTGLYEVSDYFVVNVSSPNTPGLRALQEKDALKQILESLMNEIQGRNIRKPLLLKIAPDLTEEELGECADIFLDCKLDGIIATNTTLDHSAVLDHPFGQESGGLSGAPLYVRSTEVLRFLSQRLKNQIPLIGVGGILSGQDALLKMISGAEAVQIYTGLIYRGPALIQEILAIL